MREPEIDQKDSIINGMAMRSPSGAWVPPELANLGQFDAVGQRCTD